MKSEQKGNISKLSRFRFRSFVLGFVKSDSVSSRFKNFRFVGRLVLVLNRREKFLVGVSILIRVSLVSLDLVGIYLIGTVVSFLSGSQAEQTSWFNSILTWLDQVGVPNGYAVVLVFAILFFVLKGLLSVALNNATASYLARIEVRKSEHAFEEFLSWKIETIETSTAQHIVFASTESVVAATTRAALVASTIIGEVSLLVAIAIYLAITDFVLFALVGIFFLFVGLTLNRFVTSTSGRLRKEMHLSHMSSQGTILETLASFRQVFSSRNKKTLLERFTNDRRIYSKASSRFETVTGLTRYIVEISVMLGVSLLVMQRSISDNDASSASVIAVFLAGIFRIVSSMVPLQSGLTAWRIISFQAMSALDLLETSGQEAQTEQVPVALHLKPAEVKIENLTYSHSEELPPVLKNVNMNLKPGVFAALVGPSGAGKSTLADLILGLRVPTRGKILLDGQPIVSDRAIAKRGVAYVPQSVGLFTGTLFQNVSLNFASQSKEEREEVLFALEQVGLSSLVAGLSDGIDTRLGDGGVQLSGGETQRVGISRALFEKPRLLILDEPTSALDPESQQTISESIERLRGKITIFMIAHRHETISRVDEVYSLAAGRLERLK